MLVELLGKGGQVCQAAREGKLRCPLIVRPTSEDVITGNVFQVLRAINPRWWLPQFLNEALGTRRFRQQIFRNLKIELWRNARKYPADQLPWTEGSTQIDVTISWENPATTIFVEAKYLADLASRTRGNDGSSGFPADQLIRNIRVGMWETGWLREAGLFPISTRDFAVVVFAPQLGNPLVAAYRDPALVRSSIPHAENKHQLPVTPFVGEISYAGLVRVLQANCRWLTPSERRLVQDLSEYLGHKLIAAKK
ncbi:MAG: hypothetical protein ACKVP0_14635 [Pirellulaceae bacterium]